VACVGGFNYRGHQGLNPDPLRLRSRTRDNSSRTREIARFRADANETALFIRDIVLDTHAIERIVVICASAHNFLFFFPRCIFLRLCLIEARGPKRKKYAVRRNWLRVRYARICIMTFTGRDEDLALFTFLFFAGRIRSTPRNGSGVNDLDGEGETGRKATGEKVLRFRVQTCTCCARLCMH